MDDHSQLASTDDGRPADAAERQMDPMGCEALHLLSAIEDALHGERGRPDTLPLQDSGAQLRQALGAATTAQVVTAVDLHLRQMMVGWTQHKNTTRLGAQARALMGLLHELATLPATMGPDPLAAAKATPAVELVGPTVPGSADDGWGTLLAFCRHGEDRP